MKIAIGLPKITDEAGMGMPDALTETAQAVEAAGFDGCYLADHPFPVVDETATGHHTWDPFPTLAFLAARTQRIKLLTLLVILTYRNPFMVAYSANTVDHISKGRLILGLGTGYLAPEFAALGIDFERRNEIMEDSLSVLRHAWHGEPLHMDGFGWRADGNSLLPRPVSEPHPPIWIGGNSVNAMRRAVLYGDGWIPALTLHGARAKLAHTASIASHADLRARLEKLRELMAQHGRETPLDICVSRGTLGPNATFTDAQNEIESLAELGATWVGLRIPASSQPELLDRIGEWGKELNR